MNFMEQLKLTRKTIQTEFELRDYYLNEEELKIEGNIIRTTLRFKTLNFVAAAEIGTKIAEKTSTTVLGNINPINDKEFLVVYEFSLPF